MVDEVEHPEDSPPAPANAIADLYRRRDREYWRVGELVASAADESHKKANAFRVLAIFLSAITAAKGAFDTIAGANNSCVLLVFTLIGIATTVVLGIETAFKFEKRAAELTALGARIATAHRFLETNWIALAGIEDEENQERRKRLLLEDDKVISEIYAASSAAGFNLQAAYLDKYHAHLRASSQSAAI